MKTKIKEISQPKEFKPFELVLSIETKEELETLWTIANILHMNRIQSSMEQVSIGAKVPFSSFNKCIFNTEFFKVLDSKIEELR